jgi:hypothetical protein
MTTQTTNETTTGRFTYWAMARTPFSGRIVASERFALDGDRSARVDGWTAAGCSVEMGYGPAPEAPTALPVDDCRPYAVRVRALVDGLRAERLAALQSAALAAEQDRIAAIPPCPVYRPFPGLRPLTWTESAAWMVRDAAAAAANTLRRFARWI